jgi:hypothetical protein
MKFESISEEAVILLQVQLFWERDVDILVIEKKQHPRKDQVGDENGFRNRVFGNGNLYAQRTRSDIRRLCPC